MSYDLSLWTTARVGIRSIQSLLPDGVVRDNGLELNGDSWLVSIAACEEAEAEDVPEHVEAALPRVRFLTSVSIEPIGAPTAVKERIRDAMRQLATEFDGIVDDQNVVPADG